MAKTIKKSKLKHTFQNDILFKMIFSRSTELLKHLVAQLLSLQVDDITQFSVTNPEIPPELVKDKFCRLDIKMTVGGRLVDLEVQVEDEGDFENRTLYYWARYFSSALGQSGNYADMPQTIIISITAFKMFKCKEFHSEFQLLEISRHTPLTDKMILHYFELPKIPKEFSRDDMLLLWLALFNAKTEEDLQNIEALEVPIMKQAVNAYRSAVVSPEFQELEQARHFAEISRRTAFDRVERKWQGVVAEKDALIAKLQAELSANKL